MTSVSSRETLNLADLKAKSLPRFNWRDTFTVKDEGGAESPLSAEDIKAMDDYFCQFLPPSKPCVNCGADLTGDVLQQFMGRATFTWGLAHGEGFCSGCQYPARAYHRNVGPIEFMNMVLQYHPDELSEKRSNDQRIKVVTS